MERAFEEAVAGADCLYISFDIDSLGRHMHPVLELLSHVG
jgi:arginase family enzyme